MQVIDGNGRLKVEITSTVDDLSIGVTTISGGTNGRVLYDNAGILGEIAGTSAQFIKGNGSLDSNTYLTSAVTSVGLSMPSAFSVANSPVTTSGTIAVTGAGVASQYIRGDGSLANFPTSTGGGASVSYYLNGSVSQGTIGGVAYKEMNSVPVIGAGTDFTISADGYIAQFITDVGDPNKLLIPAGNWNFETYFSASSGGGSPQFYIELYKYNGTTFTLIASNSAAPENITGGTSIDLYLSALAVPATTLLATDRLAVRFYVIHSGRTITMHTENSHLSQIITTFSTGLTALNGLTSQTQYFAVGTTGTDFNISSATDTHTFNLPTASATNRGALSSTDWTTFNGKQPLLVSGTNIKTVNSTSILGSGDISVGVTSVTASSPLLSSGGATPNLAMFQASSASNGYLSALDWLTFDGKQAALVSGGNIKTINGSSVLGSGNLVVSGGGGGIDVQTFTSSAVWTKPAGAKQVEIYLFGAGGGGGSGRRGATLTARYGGGGGGTGNVFIGKMDAASFASTENVWIGAGGNGGPAITTNDTNGANGVSGADSYFGGSGSFGTAKIIAPGGSSGQGGTNTPNASGNACGQSIYGVYQINLYGSPNLNSAVFTQATTLTMRPLTSGGMGGGITASNGANNGGSITNRKLNLTNFYTIAGGVTPSGNGANGTSTFTETNFIIMSAGGGGGATGDVSGIFAGGNGGNGAICCGGGGGGASTNGANTGAGGNGGNGLCIVVTYL